MLRNQNYNFSINNDVSLKNSSNENNFHPVNQKERNLFFDNTTPFPLKKESRKSFYSRVNTSPIKIKNDSSKDFQYYSECDETTEKKFHKEIKFPGITESIGSFTNNYDGKENDFFSPNLNTLSTANTNRFTSNSNARNQVKQLVSEGNINESKPSLNMLESRNNLIAFSKTKKYEIEKNEAIEREKIKQKERELNKEVIEIKQEEKEEEISSNVYSDEIKEESEEDAYTAKIKKQIANLPVPLNKKDDENFKLLKMKELKKKSLPPNKSAKAYDADLIPSHQKEIINGNFFSKLFRT